MLTRDAWVVVLSNLSSLKDYHTVCLVCKEAYKAAKLVQRQILRKNITYVQMRTAIQCYITGCDLLHGPQAFIRQWDKKGVWVISEYEFGKLKSDNLKVLELTSDAMSDMDQRVTNFFSSVVQKKNICDFNTTEPKKNATL